MSLVDNIRKDMFDASKSGEKEKSDILKMALASIKNAEVATGEVLDEKEIEKILRKEVKKINDSIDQFGKMGREDLVKKEKLQLDVLNAYLPELLSEEQVEQVVKAKIEELGIEDMRGMGQIMGAVMKELEGKTDGNTVKNIVQNLLS